ncbi:hypothetical protein PR048_025602 [Dryococelus australis]|uniref:DUF4371 domain-containing protein n=1 Tax=Dryococelus australis TaxID=614101 RepID=A0ABQ9GRS6_9NEOP|nr:hypothetical protein PR048_025602 [Dryococelus australis]
MPKVVRSALTRQMSSLLKDFIQVTNVLFWKICNGRVSWELERPVFSKQLVAASRYSTKGILQPIILHLRLLQHLNVNIPLQKLQEMSIIEWMNEFVEGAGDLSTVKTVREKYVPVVAEERFATVKAEVAGKFVTVLADETTDMRGKCYFVVLFHLIEPAATHVHFLETANPTFCSRVVLDLLNKYYDSYDSVLAFVIIFGGDGVVKLKAAFQNTRKCKHLYTQFLTEKYPDGTKKIIQFPVPVLTRNSWFESVLYLSMNCKKHQMQGFNTSVLSPRQKVKKHRFSLFLLTSMLHSLSLIDSEESSYPTSHILHSKLLDVKECFAVAASGIFEPETTSLIGELGHTPSG